MQIGAVVYDFSCFRETVSPGVQGSCVHEAAGCFVGAGLETLALRLLFGGEKNAFEEAEVPAELLGDEQLGGVNPCLTGGAGAVGVVPSVGLVLEGDAEDADVFPGVGGR